MSKIKINKNRKNNKVLEKMGVFLVVLLALFFNYAKVEAATYTNCAGLFAKYWDVDQQKIIINENIGLQASAENKQEKKDNVLDPFWNAGEEWGVVDCSLYDVIVADGATVTILGKVVKNNEYGVNLKTKSLEIKPTGKISADSLGFPAEAGSSPGVSGQAGAGGASGGDGANNSYGNAGGKSYGSALHPALMGSGGGNGWNGTGGTGGGSIRIDALNDLIISGTISANGGNGSMNTGGYRDSGGGAGGSVLIIARDKLQGAGKITANGGNTRTEDCCSGPGAGGGGRIAVYFENYIFNTNTLHLNSAAEGGDGWRAYDGQAGTVAFFKTNNDILPIKFDVYAYKSFEFCQIDAISNNFFFNSFSADGVSRPNGGEIRIEAGTEPQKINIINSVILKDTIVIVEGNSILNVGQNLSVSRTTKTSSIYGLGVGGKLSLEIKAVGDVSFGAGTTVNFDGDGYAAQQGIGKGIYGTAGSGGAHGGDGANSSYPNVTGGKSYGSATRPITMGSGGGNGASGIGGEGGGLVSVEALGNLKIDGVISANGNRGSEATGGYRDGGGGAGGGVYIKTNGTLSGNGAVTANGGITQTGDCCSGPGAGGGGRIAIYFEYYDTSLNTLHSNSAAEGGDGWRTYDGQAGTIGFFDINGTLDNFTDDSLYVYKTFAFTNNDAVLDVWPYKNILLKKGDARIEKALANKTFKVEQNFEIEDCALEIANNTLFEIKGNFSLKDTGGKRTRISGWSSGQELQAEFMISGDSTIGAGAMIDFSGDGYAATKGLGAGASGQAGSGAGHGGDGNRNSYGNLGGNAYGSSLLPFTLGSGGGNGSSGTGGAGGGVIKMDVIGNLTVDGQISSGGDRGSAATGGYLDGGGGAGGSIYLRTRKTLTGKGVLASVGGGTQTGDCCSGPGGGSGGKITVYFEDYDLATNSLHASVDVRGGDGWGSYDGEFGTAGFFDINGTADVLTDDDLYAYKNFAFVPEDAVNDVYSFRNIYLRGGDMRTRNKIPAKTYTFNVAQNFELNNATFGIADSSIFNVGSTVSFLNPGANRTKLFGWLNGEELKIEFNADKMLMDPGTTIDLSGDGYNPARGPGAGASGQAGGGGGHGGKGGNSSNGSAGGAANDSLEQPIEPGSGGGNGWNGIGGAGGGLLKLIIKNDLTINGSIIGNGLNGSANTDGYRDGGGGAGGTIYMETKTIAGTGSLTAIGGNARAADCCAGPGGGGGGRIAVTIEDCNAPPNPTPTISLATVAAGGNGWRAAYNGQAGTIKIASKCPPPTEDPQIPEDLLVINPLTNSSDCGKIVGKTNEIKPLHFEDRYYELKLPADEEKRRACISVWPKLDPADPGENFKNYIFPLRGRVWSDKLGSWIYFNTKDNPLPGDYAVNIKLTDEPGVDFRQNAYLTGRAWNEKVGFIKFDWDCSSPLFTDNTAFSCYDRPKIKKHLSGTYWSFSGDAKVETTGEEIKLDGAWTNEWDALFARADLSIKFINDTYKTSDRRAIAGILDSGYLFNVSYGRDWGEKERLNLWSGDDLRSNWRESWAPGTKVDVSDKCFDKIVTVSLSPNSKVFKDQIAKIGDPATKWEPPENGGQIVFEKNPASLDWQANLKSDAPTNGENFYQIDKIIVGIYPKQTPDVTCNLKNTKSDGPLFQDIIYSSFINLPEGIKEGNVSFAQPVSTAKFVQMINGEEKSELLVSLYFPCDFKLKSTEALTDVPTLFGSRNLLYHITANSGNNDVIFAFPAPDQRDKPNIQSFAYLNELLFSTTPKYSGDPSAYLNLFGPNLQAEIWYDAWSSGIVKYLSGRFPQTGSETISTISYEMKPEIKGTINVSSGTKISDTETLPTIGDISGKGIWREKVIRNVSKWITGTDMTGLKGEGIVALSSDDLGKNREGLVIYKNSEPRLYYFENNVKINGTVPVSGEYPRINKWKNNKTIVVKGGDVYINSDLWDKDDGEENSLGLIALAVKDSTKKSGFRGGNVYIEKGVSFLNGINIAADGSVYRYNENKKLKTSVLCPDENPNPYCLEEPNLLDDTGKFAAHDLLNKQLFFNGSIASGMVKGGNTTGGSLPERSMLGDSQKTTNLDEASLYDYIKFSYFHLGYEVCEEAGKKGVYTQTSPKVCVFTQGEVKRKPVAEGGDLIVAPGYSRSEVWEAMGVSADEQEKKNYPLYVEFKAAPSDLPGLEGGQGGATTQQ